MISTALPATGREWQFRFPFLGNTRATKMLEIPLSYYIRVDFQDVLMFVWTVTDQVGPHTPKNCTLNKWIHLHWPGAKQGPRCQPWCDLVHSKFYFTNEIYQLQEVRQVIFLLAWISYDNVKTGYSRDISRHRRLNSCFNWTDDGAYEQYELKNKLTFYKDTWLLSPTNKQTNAASNLISGLLACNKSSVAKINAIVPLLLYHKHYWLHERPCIQINTEII